MILNIVIACAVLFVLFAAIRVGLAWRAYKQAFKDFDLWNDKDKWGAA